MGCGCKKNKNVQPVPEPANISLSNVQVTEQGNLTQEQQQQVETIIDKLDEMSSSD